MITDGLNPLTVLLFVGAIVAGAALIVVYVIARVVKREPLARITLRTLLGGVGLYLLLFLGASVFSHNRVLAPGEEKHICEIDCHLAYSVAATKAEALPSGGLREIVTVKVRFDEETISSRRPRDATLTPNSRYVALVDDGGHQYAGSSRRSSSGTRTVYCMAAPPSRCRNRADDAPLNRLDSGTRIRRGTAGSRRRRRRLHDARYLRPRVCVSTRTMAVPCLDAQCLGNRRGGRSPSDFVRRRSRFRRAEPGRRGSHGPGGICQRIRRCLGELGGIETRPGAID